MGGAKFCNSVEMKSLDLFKNEQRSFGGGDGGLHCSSTGGGEIVMYSISASSPGACGGGEIVMYSISAFSPGGGARCRKVCMSLS